MHCAVNARAYAARGAVTLDQHDTAYAAHTHVLPPRGAATFCQNSVQVARSRSVQPKMGAVLSVPPLAGLGKLTGQAVDVLKQPLSVAVKPGVSTMNRGYAPIELVAAALHLVTARSKAIQPSGVEHWPAAVAACASPLHMVTGLVAGHVASVVWHESSVAFVVSRNLECSLGQAADFTQPSRALPGTPAADTSAS